MSSRKLSQKEKDRLNIALSAACLKADIAILDIITLLENSGKPKHALAFKQLLLNMRVQYNRATL